MTPDRCHSVQLGEGALGPVSKKKSKGSQGSEDTQSSQGIRKKIHTLSTTLSMKLQLRFFSMNKGYRSFPEVTQPTSAMAYLDPDKCQIKSRARIKNKQSLVTQKLQKTC